MRRNLGALVLSAALTVPSLTGCGGGDAGSRAEDDAGGSASSSSSSSSSPSSSSPSASHPASGDTVDFTEIALLSLTGGGGRVDPRATVLDGPATVDRFAAQFRNEALGNQLDKAIRKADVSADQRLAAAVVSIGCDVPPGVVVQELDGRLAIVPRKVASPLPECLAAVTTVALVAVDASVV